MSSVLLGSEKVWMSSVLLRKGVDVLGFARFCPDNDAQQGTGAEEVKRQADMEY